MEGAGPGYAGAGSGTTWTLPLSDDALDSPRHFHGSSAREGQEQDAPRVGTGGYQLGDPVRQRIGLTRACPGDNEQRARDRPLRQVCPVVYRELLLGVEGFHTTLSPHPHCPDSCPRDAREHVPVAFATDWLRDRPRDQPRLPRSERQSTTKLQSYDAIHS